MEKPRLQVLAMSNALAAMAKAAEAFQAKRSFNFSGPKRRKTGKRYPFSSDRQNARFARQLQADKVRFA